MSSTACCAPAPTWASTHSPRFTHSPFVCACTDDTKCPRKVCSASAAGRRAGRAPQIVLCLDLSWFGSTSAFKTKLRIPETSDFLQNSHVLEFRLCILVLHSRDLARLERAEERARTSRRECLTGRMPAPLGDPASVRYATRGLGERMDGAMPAQLRKDSRYSNTHGTAALYSVMRRDRAPRPAPRDGGTQSARRLRRRR